MFNFITRLFKPKYKYVVIINADGTVRHKARLNMKTNRVEFVLWKAGEQGYKDDCWHVMGYGWEDKFYIKYK